VLSTSDCGVILLQRESKLRILIQFECLVKAYPLFTHNFSAGPRVYVPEERTNSTVQTPNASSEVFIVTVWTIVEMLLMKSVIYNLVYLKSRKLN
jgi:hypothetical protein